MASETTLTDMASSSHTLAPPGTGPGAHWSRRSNLNTLISEHMNLTFCRPKSCDRLAFSEKVRLVQTCFFKLCLEFCVSRRKMCIFTFFFCRSVSQSARFCGASVPHAVCGSLPQLRPKPQRAFFFSFLVAATADFANNTLE